MSQFDLQGTKEYKPKFLVRMLGRMYDELVLRNIFSINTTISTTNIDGGFQVVLDNRYSPEQFWSLYHLIQPMDYIEIFMRRDDSIDLTEIDSSLKIINNNNPPGSTRLNKISEHGYIGPPTSGDVDGIFYPADPLVISPETGEPSPFLMETHKNTEGKPVTVFKANGGFKSAVVDTTASTPNSVSTVSLITKIARPLNALEKANTPDFVFCGFVDSVQTNFSMSAQGDPQAVIVIAGRSLGKILTTHEIYQNAIVNNPLTSLFLGAEILQLSPPDAITEIIDKFLVLGTAIAPLDIVTLKTVSPSSSPVQTALAQAKNLENQIGPQLQKKLQTFQNIVSTITLTQGEPRTFAVFRRKFINALLYTKGNPVTNDGLPNPKSRHNDVLPARAPGTTTLSPLTTSHDIYGNPSGRMSITPSLSFETKVRSLANLQDGPIINAVKQVCNLFVNELWVDECGRIVLRSMPEAWFQPLYQLIPTGDQLVEPNEFEILSQQANSANKKQQNQLGNLIENILFERTTLGSQIVGVPVLAYDPKNPASIKLSAPQLTMIKSNTNVIEGEDIISWNFTKSDAEFKTLVILQDVLNLLGAAPIQNFGGAAPTSSGTLSIILASYISAAITSAFGVSNTVANSTEETQALTTLNGDIRTRINSFLSGQSSGTDTQQNFSSFLDGIILDLSTTFSTLNISLKKGNEIIKNLSDALTAALGNQTARLFFSPFSFFTYRLDNSFQIIDFWQDFLLRVDMKNDIFSSTTVNSYVLAYFYFLQSVQFFSTGTLVLKGNPRYKAGHRIYVRPLNADFYVTSVSHDFRWGTAPYTTVLSVSRGVFFGTLSAINSAGNIGKDTVNATLADLASASKNEGFIYFNLLQ